MPLIMKTPPRFVSSRAGHLFCAALLIFGTPLFAEPPSVVAPPAPPRQTDPFVKKEAMSPGTKALAQVVNLCMTLEVYSLNQNDAAKLLGEAASGPARHDRVRELVTKHQARLESVLSNATKSGQRAVVEQIDEVRYANDFQPAAGTEPLPHPATYETRNVGDTFEWEPVLLDAGQRCDLNLVVTSVRFDGFAEFLEPQRKVEFAQPRFSTRKITAAQTVPVGVMQFMGTLSAAPRFESAEVSNAEAKKGGSLEVKLLFGRVDAVRLASQPEKKDSSTGVLEHQLSFFSLDREAARTILGGVAKPGAVYAAVQPLLAKNEAKLERLLVLKTKSGQRATTEEIEEVRYLIGTDDGTNFDAAKPPKGQQSPKGGVFETRNTGMTLEIEPVLDPSATLVDLNLVPQFVSLIGKLQADGVAAKYLPQPVFEARKVTTSICVALGEQAFIGTFNHPGYTGVNGQKDTGRVWLGFVQTKLVRE